MRPEDVSKIFDDAFAKVKPKTEAERKQLERIRERINEKAKQFANRVNTAPPARRDEPPAELSLPGIAPEQSTKDLMAAELAEQAALIDRIRQARTSR